MHTTRKFGVSFFLPGNKWTSKAKLRVGFLVPRNKWTLSDMAFVDAEKFSKIYITFTVHGIQKIQQNLESLHA